MINNKNFQHLITNFLFFIILNSLHILSIVYAQEPNFRFESISIEQGLSQSDVFYILQDSKGFMWFGTRDGLNKYDGTNIKIYSYHTSDSNCISNNWVLSLCEDRDGIIWIGTLDGLNKFDPRTMKFTHYKNDPADPHSLSFNTVLSIYEDRTGKLWIKTYGSRINIFDKETETFTRYLNDPDHPESHSNSVYDIFEDSSGLVWIATYGSGLGKYDPESQQFTHYKHDPADPHSLSIDSIYTICESKIEPGVLWIGTKNGGLNKFDIENEKFYCYQHDVKDINSISHNDICDLYEDNSGTLWIGTWGGGLCRLNPEDRDIGKFKRYVHDKFNPNSINCDSVQSVFEDQAGNLWITTEQGGLNYFDREQDKFIYFKHNPNDYNSLSHNRIRTIYEDESGILWLGTLGGGITKLFKPKGGFVHYKNNPSIPNSLNNNHVNAIIEDKAGILWIGTDNGLNKYNRFTNQWEHYKHDPNNSNSLCDNLIFSLCESIENENSIIWIGTGMGLNKFDSEKEEFIWYRPNQQEFNGLSGNLVFSICEDKSGILWIGSNGGLNKFDRVSNRWTYYEHNPQDPNSLTSNLIYIVFEDSYGFLWIGTDKGLNKLVLSELERIDKNNNQFICFTHNPENSNSLSGNRIIAIFEDNIGNLWIGTEFRGFNKFDRGKNMFNQYCREHGLPNNTIHGILGDTNGNVWMSTNKGISKFNPETEIFKSYSKNDGLQGNEFNTGAYYRSKSGEMFFGGDHGFNSFYPDRLIKNSYIPPVVITNFQIFNEPVKLGSDSLLQQHITYTQALTLSYRQNVFSFEFAALDYRSPGRNQYAYMMEGIDKDWIYCGNRRFANYSHIKAGEYIFKVKGSNNDGIWNEIGTSIKIIITPPFWQTWWFQMLIVVIIGAIIMLIHNYRVSRRLEMERMRVRIASDLHDDIGATLTKIAVHSEVIKTANDTKKILPSAKKIGDMSREIVTTMSDIVWSIDARNDTIGDLIDRMRDFALNVLTPQQIKVYFISSGMDSAKKISVDVRQNIYLVFKEAINNTAKHAQATEVEIKLKNLNGKFIMNISDNGKGMHKKDEDGTGHGLRNMKMRAKRIDADLEIQGDQGVSVTLRMKEL